MARPPILLERPDVQDKIVQALRAGNYLETAAAWAGVTVVSIRNWLRRGSQAASRQEQGLPIPQEDEVYLRFFAVVREAQAHAEVRDVARIAQAAETDWRAAAWRLEHRSPARWGRQTVKVEHDVAADAGARAGRVVESLRGTAEGRAALAHLYECLEGDAGDDGAPAERGALDAGEAPPADQ